MSDNQKVIIETEGAVETETKKVPLMQRKWMKNSLKVLKETSKYVAGAAAGVGGVILFQHLRD